MSKQSKQKLLQLGKKIWLWVKKYGLKYFFRFLTALVALTLLLRVVPLPFSAYMAQQKIWHLITFDFDYKVRYDWVSLEDISPHMQLAVIAAEDQHFPEHYGFDWKAIKNAMSFNQASSRMRGGSTISQQTVKNLYLWHGQSWIRKGIEVPITLMLETLWSKQRILEVYLNIAEFGYGIFGVEAASQHYFKKSAKQLNASEAALLAAVLPNPIIYRVNQPSPYVKQKQRWILRQMNSLGRSYLQEL